MPRPFKIALIAVGGCVALLTLAAAVVPLLLDSDSYKPRIEAAAAAASGLDVGIDGRLRLGLFPGLHVTLENVRLRHRDADIASVAEAAFGIELGALLRREVRIDSIRLHQPRIALARNPDGTLDLPAPQPSGAAPGPFELANLSVTDATLTY
ncbi:MAG: AsmA family protein, partial [Thauera sp.]|nr:AsmA family protein [Thauera sp.]